MEFKELKAIYKFMDNARVPGEAECICIAFKGERAMFNNKECSSIEAVEKAYTMLIHKAISCDYFSNGSWLRDVNYATLKDIEKQTDENYYVDTTMMNFLFSLKVVANECIKHPEKIYFAMYNSDVEDYDISEGEKEIKRLLDMIS